MARIWWNGRGEIWVVTSAISSCRRIATATISHFFFVPFYIYSILLLWAPKEINQEGQSWVSFCRALVVVVFTAATATTAAFQILVGLPSRRVFLCSLTHSLARSLVSLHTCFLPPTASRIFLLCPWRRWRGAAHSRENFFFCISLL